MSLHDLRYDFPRVFWTAASLLFVTAAFTIFLMLPENRFFEATGVNEGQRRVVALRNAAYWYSRSLIHASAEDLHFSTRFGNVLRFEDGHLVSSIPTGQRFEEVALQFADVVVTSPDDADAAIRAVSFKDAKFEIYHTDKSVVWIGGKPLNITLIEVGAAQPDPNPPTNIVDIAFASYYWKQAKGEIQ